MNAEYINKVELQGVVGHAKRIAMGKQTGFLFTLAVNRTFTDELGGVSVETDWINCYGWDMDGAEETLLEKGRKVHLTGRLHTQRYITAEGYERQITDVIVHDIRSAR